MWLRRVPFTPAPAGRAQLRRATANPETTVCLKALTYGKNLR